MRNNGVLVDHTFGHKTLERVDFESSDCSNGLEADARIFGDKGSLQESDRSWLAHCVGYFTQGTQHKRNELGIFGQITEWASSFGSQPQCEGKHGCDTTLE